MSLKLSAGCKCCPDLCWCATGGIPTEFDVTLSGWTQGSETCTDPLGFGGTLDCTHFDDTLTFCCVNRAVVSAGWGTIYYYTAADGTFHAPPYQDTLGQMPIVGYENSACAWYYKVPVDKRYCHYEIDVDLDRVEYTLDIAYLALIRFPMPPDSSHITQWFLWRLLPFYEMELLVKDTETFDQTHARSKYGWYYEYDGGEGTDCRLDGSEIWTAIYPPALSVTTSWGGDTYTADFDDFCVGSLSLDSVVVG